MKILFISNLLPPFHIGGYEIACFDTFNLLKENNFECALLTSDYRFNQENSENEKGQAIYRTLKLHTDFENEVSCLPYSVVASYNNEIVQTFVKEFNPDVVYYWNLWGLGSEIIQRSNPEISVFHIMDFSIFNYDFSYSAYFKYKLLKNRCKPIIIKNYLKRVIFISKFVSERFNGFDLIQSTKIYPFLNNLETYSFKMNYPDLRNKFKAVYLGQIEAHKGIINLCAVIKEINDSFGYIKIHLDIFGASQSGLDKVIISNFNSFVNIIKVLPRKGILNNLKNYDLGFFPSIWEEPFGIAQIEMMAAGLPIISSGMGGSSEMIDTRNSLSYKTKEELKECILELINNYYELAKIIGPNARKKVLDECNTERYLYNIVNFFKDNRLT